MACYYLLGLSSKQNKNNESIFYFHYFKYVVKIYSCYLEIKN